MKLKGSQLRSIVWEEHPDWTQKKHEIVDQSRWDTSYFGVFEHTPTGKHYGFSWSEGSTETQDTSPFEFDLDTEFELKEYVQRQVMKMEWQPK